MSVTILSRLRCGLKTLKKINFISHYVVQECLLFRGINIFDWFYWNRTKLNIFIQLLNCRWMKMKKLFPWKKQTNSSESMWYLAIVKFIPGLDLTSCYLISPRPYNGHVETRLRCRPMYLVLGKSTYLEKIYLCVKKGYNNIIFTYYSVYYL